VVLLAACGRPNPDSPARELSPQQQSSVTTPGVTVTGYAVFGVTRRF